MDDEATRQVWIETSVLDTIRAEAAKFSLSETGGVLFGYWTRDHETGDREVVVTEATGPGPRAIHTRHSFEPDMRYCQGRLAEVYARTEGYVTYVGDWHTHPRGQVAPSRRDSRTARDIAIDPDVRIPEPVLFLYRPSDQFLWWQWKEALAVWIFETPRRIWRPTDLRRYSATTEAAEGHSRTMRPLDGPYG